MDAVVKEEENMIEPKKEVEESVELKEAKIDEEDVKMEEIDDTEYQNMVPYEYRDYLEQHTVKEQATLASKRGPAETRRNVSVRCLKCNKPVVVGSYLHVKNHAAIHTNLIRFKCDKCNYGSWNRANVQIHIDYHYEIEPCAMQEVQLSEKEQLELRSIARECFPRLADRFEKRLKINECYIKQRAEIERRTNFVGSTKGVRVRCQKCKRVVTVDCFSTAVGHAVSHIRLSRDLSYFNTFKCDQCDYGSWSRSIVQQHINLQHKNKSCLAKEVKLSEEEQLEMKSLTEECFPGIDKMLKRKAMVNEKVVKVEDEDIPLEQSTISRKRPYQSLEEKKDESEIMIDECFPGFDAILPPRYSYEEKEKQEENIIEPKKEVEDTVELKEPKVELIDEEDVKLEEIDDNEYQHIIPHEYRDYSEQHKGKQPKLCNTSHRKSVQCQNCSKFVAVRSFADAKRHAVIHTSLIRFKCMECNYGSWRRANVQHHMLSRHNKKSCSMQKIQLSEKDHLEWSKVAKECFPSEGEAVSTDDTIMMEECIPGMKVETRNEPMSNVMPHRRYPTKYTCLVCNVRVIETLSNPSAARRDHALQHTKVQLYKCIKNDCNFKTNNSRLIRDHHREQHRLVFGLVPRAKVEITNEQEMEIERMVIQCFPELKED